MQAFAGRPASWLAGWQQSGIWRLNIVIPYRHCRRQPLLPLSAAIQPTFWLIFHLSMRDFQMHTVFQSESIQHTFNRFKMCRQQRQRLVTLGTRKFACETSAAHAFVTNVAVVVVIVSLFA